MNEMPKQYQDVQACVEDIIGTVGKEIVLGLPIGVGKPTIIANELYRMAQKDPSLSLVICSGLTVQPPHWASELERRFMQPLVERIFGDYPSPVYFKDALDNKLPDNVEIREVYFQAGSALRCPALQATALSSNYTHVARDVSDMGCNVTAAIVCRGGRHGREFYNLGSNADASVMTLWNLDKARKQGRRAAILGQVNPDMPYMYGDSEVAPGIFTGILDNPKYYHRLFGSVASALSNEEHAAGLYVSSLIRDGGTFQVGFGSLGDAIVYATKLRQEHNDVYNQILGGTGIMDKFGEVINRVGGTGVFEEGLYAASEFITDGFMHLWDAGILKRRVYDSVPIQSLLNEKKISTPVSGDTLKALLDCCAISPRITGTDFEFLQKFGIFKDSIKYSGGKLLAGDETLEPDLSNPADFDSIVKTCLGHSLKNGILIHAGFFLGTQGFYETMRTLDEERRASINMRAVSFVNQLYEGDALKRLQRIKPRFINMTMAVNVLGGALSDTLDDGQTLSGVGGQYNFVAMAHALDDGRSILVLRSVRESKGKLESNIIYGGGHVTIPRHLRDIVVTEYGIAELRGKTDRDTIMAMLKITDSRFQDELLKKAVENGKLPKNACIPPQFRNNYPDKLAESLKPFKPQGLFPAFPFGTELSKTEIILGRTLKNLKAKLDLKNFKLPDLSDVGKILSPPEAANVYLERLQLDKPSNAKEQLLRTLVVYALATDGVI